MVIDHMTSHPPAPPDIDDPRAIAVRASFPDLISAIRASGDRNGCRITIDIPELDTDQVKRLMDLRGTIFYVVFVAIEPPPDEPPPAPAEPPTIRRAPKNSRRVDKDAE